MIPSSRRFSLESAIRFRSARAGRRSARARRRSARSPLSARSTPLRSEASSVRPEPRSPAKPTISPRCSSRSVGATAPAAAEAERPVDRGDRRAGGGARGGRSRSAASASMSLPIIFAISSARSMLAGGVLADGAAVAQHRHAVAEGQHLLEEVRDEEDRDALVAQPPQHREEAGDVAEVEARGRLVEHQHARMVDHRAADRDELADRGGAASAAAGADRGRRDRARRASRRRRRGCATRRCRGVRGPRGRASRSRRR